MEVATCKHKEVQKPAGGRYTIGTCTICHQETRYPIDNLEGPPVVIKLGRRDGKIVMPDGHCKIQLGEQDIAELNAASSVEKAAHEEEELPADIPPRPGKDDPKGRLKWFKENKKQLVDALIRMGAEAFKEKLSLPRQVVSHLKASKEYGQQIQKTPPVAKETKATKHRSAKKKSKDDGSGALPPWNDEWAPEVQLRWLEIYEKHFMH